MDSKAQLIIVAIVALLIGVAVGYVAKPSSSPSSIGTTTQQAKQTTVIQIGGLFPLSGDLQTFGQQNSLALQMAASDINSFFNASGIPYQVKVIIEDTQTNPDVAVSRSRSLQISLEWVAPLLHASRWSQTTPHGGHGHPSSPTALGSHLGKNQQGLEHCSHRPA